MTHHQSSIKNSHRLHPAEPVPFLCAVRPKANHATVNPLDPAAKVEPLLWNATVAIAPNRANRPAETNAASIASSQSP